MEIKQRRRKTYDRREVKSDYMKYWRTIRRYIQVKYDLSEPDLDVLMFLYSEQLFTYYKFLEFANDMSWDRERFKRLKDNEWIHMYSDKYRGQYRLYELTRKGRHVITKMYKHLSMELEISEVPKNNPVFNRARFSDRTLATSITKFNEEVRKKNKKVTVY